MYDMPLNPWFVWKNKNSLANFGIWISKLPAQVRPEERHEEIEVPGRAGSLLMLEGDDVYKSYTAEMTICVRNILNLSLINNWLRGSSELILSNDATKARQARIVGEVKFERIGAWLQQATVPFLFQPFRKSRNNGIDDRVTITASSGSIINPGDVASRPIVSITGSGDNEITIAGQTMSFANLSGTVVVDCGAQMVTKNGEIWTESVTGDFWKIPTGASTIAQTGGDSIQIDPEWRWF